MFCRILILFWILLACCAGPSDLCARTVDVKIEGIEAPLYTNVLNGLSIYTHKDSSRLDDDDIQRLHQQANEEIIDALAPLGYFHPQIDAHLQQTADGFTATYRIDPGAPVTIRSIALEMDNDDDERQGWFDQAKSEFPLKLQDVLDQGLYEEGKKHLLRTAMHQGFLVARFSVHELRIDRKELTADIILHLQSGPRYLFGDTTFSQDILQDKLLAKLVPYKKGDPYSTDKMMELQRTLYRTNYFRRVQIQGKKDDADGLFIPVAVDLKPLEKWNRYSFGVGYATDTGARTRFDWFNRLMNSHGDRMKATAQISQYENSVGCTYEIPVGNPNNDNYAITSSYTDQNWDDTKSKLYSFAVAKEHGGKFFRYGESLEIRQEDYTVGVTSGKSTLLVPGLTGTVIQADDVLNTANGFEISLTTSGAVDGLASDASFLKLLSTGKLIVSPLASYRIIGRGALGAVLVSSIDELPPSLRFYAGGDNSVRGYGYKKLGTKDSSGAIVGGRYLMVGSVELEKSVSEKWAIATFWDAGNAMDDLSVELKQGAGVGVRFRLPFGQVRFDVASAILEDGMPLRLHLTVGSDL